MVFTLKHSKDLRSRTAMRCIRWFFSRMKGGHMTKNQIEFAKLQEQQRANRAQEALTGRRDTLTAQLGLNTLEETKRANRERERQNTVVLGETQRHNLRLESLQAIGLDETSRHNKAQEQVSLQVANETARSNRARERETSRANKAQELEANRSNRVREAETARANRAREAEDVRAHNLNYDIGRQNVALGYGNLWESQRRTDLQIEQNYAELAERQRHQRAVEQETKRSNRQNEALNKRKQIEAERHNKKSENIDIANTVIRGADVVTDAGTDVAKLIIPLL